jgi:hypothetical protein
VTLPVEVIDAEDPQMAVFVRCFQIYRDRQEQHGDPVWQASGWRGMLVDMRKKLDRLWYATWDADDETVMLALDSAFDLINYTAFFIRQAEDANRDGSWPWEVEDGCG